MYRIKQSPEDFCVFERMDLKLSDEGRYMVALMEKKGLTTEEAVKIVAGKLGVRSKDVGYCGAKDKDAVTSQYISVKGGGIPKDMGPNLKLTPLGRSDSPLFIGAHHSNEFRIVVRGVDGLPEAVAHVPNYFDDQRFSSMNVEVGLDLLRRDFAAASEKIGLVPQGNDFLAALRAVPIRILRMYIHSVQSKIFNELLAAEIRRLDGAVEVPYSQGSMAFADVGPGDLPDSIPIVGFGSDEVPGDCSLSPRDFVFREYPQLSAEGGRRPSLVQVEGLRISKRGSDAAEVSFSLPKGSYATVVIRALWAGRP